MPWRGTVQRAPPHSACLESQGIRACPYSSHYTSKNSSQVGDQRPSDSQALCLSLASLLPSAWVGSQHDVLKKQTLISHRKDSCLSHFLRARHMLSYSSNFSGNENHQGVLAKHLNPKDHSHPQYQDFWEMLYLFTFYFFMCIYY